MEGADYPICDGGEAMDFMAQGLLSSKKRCLGGGQVLHIGRSRPLDTERQKKGLRSEARVVRRKLQSIEDINCLKE